MRAYFFVGLCILWAAMLGNCIGLALASDPPVAQFPPQQNPDTFQYAGASLDKYNPHSRELRDTGVWTWRFDRNPSCSGDVRPFVVQAVADLGQALGVTFIEDSASAHLIYQNCGPSLASRCGATNINCLWNGYPYNVQIDLSSDLATYFPISSVSIVEHEMFHAMATWNEQYKLDGNFSSSSDQTVMNTGVLSRHYVMALETARWWRTMGSPEIPQRDAQGRPNIGYGFNGAWYVWACNFDTNAARLSVLVDLHDGRGVQWSGVIVPISPSRGCQGVGVQEGLRIVVGAEYFIKQENAVSWFVSRNEARVP